MYRRVTVPALAVLLILLAVSVTHGTAFYVDAAATGANNGTSWANAFTTIQAGTDAAHAAPGGAEVWVKAGRYTGCNSPPFSDSFEALDPDAVDILGEEREFAYGALTVKRYCHVTIFNLTGDVTVAPARASFLTTSENDTLTTRLTDLVQNNPGTFVIVCHPSFTYGQGTILSPSDLAEAANCGAMNVMEIRSPEDAGKWDYVLAHLDDQAGACSKILWGINCEDQHDWQDVSSPVMAGAIPTSAQDPVYTNRRLAFKDMMRRGSVVAQSRTVECGVPTYTMTSDNGTAGRIEVRMYARSDIGAGMSLRFYGCDWQTGNTPGTVLYQAALTSGAVNTVSYYLTQDGTAGGTPLTAQQKANIKYIRPAICSASSPDRYEYLQPVRIKSDGNWWNGPAYALAGGHAVIGPSPYPSGTGTDTAETIYFNTHAHTLMSDGNVTPQTMRRVYWEQYGVTDPTKPRFSVLTDHETISPFAPAARSVVLLKEGARVYGGFAGGETSRSQRNWSANVTIIDAELQGRCIYSDGSDWSDFENAVLDGFTIKNGKVGGNGGGGGMLNWQCCPTVANCTFTASQAAFGAGMMSSLASPAVTGCAFRNNSAGSATWRSGGGMLNEGLSSAVVTNCEFTSNTARRGGGMYNAGSEPIVSGCLFKSNRTEGFIGGWGGGMYNYRSASQITACTFEDNTANNIDGNGGAMYNRQANPNVSRCVFKNNHADAALGKGGGMRNYLSSPIVTNCVFAGNTTVAFLGIGGAIYHEQGSEAVFTNNTITGNNAFYHGGIYCLMSSPGIFNNMIVFNNGSGISNDDGAPVLSNNDVYGNSPDYVDVSPGPGDISADPHLAGPSTGDYHIVYGSPCMDAGEAEVPGLPLLDMDGQERFWGLRVDIGADELWPASHTGLYVKGMADTAGISLTSAVVSAHFTDDFYIESDDRCWGIRVEKPGHSFTAGMRVNVNGLLGTGSNGERYILAGTAFQNGAGSVEPLYMSGKLLGGEDFYYSGNMGQKGVKNGLGPNNIGLLISTTGRVTYAGPGYFYIDDGSARNDGSGRAGVKVLSTVPDPSPEGKYVKVTGISSCLKVGNDLYPQIRATEVSLAE